MSLAYIYSLVFFITFAISVIFLIDILSMNMKNVFNKLFFAVCAALSIWAFCFSVANSAQNYGIALFWRRMSAFGWGIIYSIILHFSLVLTEKNKILKNKLIYLLIYIPAGINIFIFGLSDFAKGQYNLINTAAGWINVSGSTLGDLYFNLYYISFSILAVLLVLNWGKKARSREKKKQSKIFVISFATATILGTMTDMIVNVYTSFKVPQLAPVFAAIPVICIFYAIKRYGLMNTSKSHRTEPGKILSDVNLEKFIQLLSLVLIIGGMLNFATQYFFYPIHPNLNSVLLFSSFFFAMGAALQIIKRLPIRTEHQETIFIILVLASCSIITIEFIKFGSITVWAAPFIIIMLSVLFNKRRMIMWLGASILATQIYIWLKVPTVTVQVDGSDYFARIGILSITIWLAYFVNRAYLQRLEENENQIRFQKMVSIISTNFVTVNEANLNEKIDYLLELSGKYFRMDRTYFISLSEKLKTHEWCREGIESKISSITLDLEDAIPWLMKLMENNEVVCIPDVEMMPEDATKENESLKFNDVKSLFAMPINSKGRKLGYLLFISKSDIKALSDAYSQLMKIIGNLLSDALIKVEAEKEISCLAYYDSLTKLPNRTLFKNRLEQSIYSAKRSETFIGVIFIDLDAFKTVNDTIGHFGGDELLRQVANRLSGCIRKQDTVSRFSGDEFLIQINQITNVEDIRKISEKIIKYFTNPIAVDEHEFFITVSMGVAVFPTDGDNAELLIKNADLAMYVAKENGKNQFRFCSTDIKEDSMKKIVLTNSLYRALEKKELILHYQPQVSVSKKEIIGFEALLRWNNSEFGIVPPSVFIPLAEQTGLINPIGKWVIETACRQSKEWQDMGFPPLRMAVNLSIDQFRDRKLISIVKGILCETGLEAKYLDLEITESIAIEGEEYVVQGLHELQDLGVHISIDDFGTSYSSLSRLKTLPIDQLKIDMQFVQGILLDNKDKAIAKTIIQLARNLKLNVIAEGVETKEQFEFFKKQKCDEIQGFYFYKPMPAYEIEAILIERY